MPLIQKAREYVEKHIAADFHDKRLASLEALKLANILKRKNPYLFKAKAINSAPDLVKQLLLAHLSSQEETLFGGFLENLAIHICQHDFGGQKSTTEGIDLEFSRDGHRYYRFHQEWTKLGQLFANQENAAKLQSGTPDCRSGNTSDCSQWLLLWNRPQSGKNWKSSQTLRPGFLVFDFR